MDGARCLDDGKLTIFRREEPATEEELNALLVPCADERIQIWPVDKRVGNVRNNEPQLAKPIHAEPSTWGALV